MRVNVLVFIRCTYSALLALSMLLGTRFLANTRGIFTQAFDLLCPGVSNNRFPIYKKNMGNG